MPLDSTPIFSILDRVTDANGDPVSGGSVEFYDAGTTTPKTVYSDSTLSTSLGSTVNLDSGGYPVSGGSTKTMIYTGTAAFKCIVKDSSGTTLITHDNVPGAVTIPTTDEIALPETPVVSRTSSYSILTTDQAKLINADPTGGSFAITLPSAVTVGDGWRVGVRHSASSSNAVTVRSTGGQTIGMPGQASATSMSLTGLGHARWFVSDGAGWTVDTEVPPIMGGPLPYIKITDRLTAPPASPTGGARYIINGSPSGAWSTLSFAENQVVESDGNGSWLGYTPANGWMAWVDDEDLVTVYHDSAWEDWSNVTAPTSTTLQHAVFQHQEANGTVGGTPTTGAWTKRGLNTETVNTITGASLASGQITLPVGTYLINFRQEFYRPADVQTRIKVISGTASPDPILTNWALWYGLDSATDAPSIHGATPSGFGILTVTATAVIELQYYVSANFGGTSGLGAVSGEPTGSPEVYARVAILSLAAQQGPAGDQGVQGPDGLDAAHYYQWSTSTSGDPGTGKLSINNATPASATELLISDTNAAGGSMTNIINSWDSATSTAKGRIKWSKEGTPGTAMEFLVTGTVTDNGSYFSVPVSYVNNSGSFTNGIDLAVLFIDKGDQGDPGTTVPDISGLTNLTEFDATADELIVYDTSAASHKALFLEAAKRYGAALDGSTDDTAALQALHDSGLVDAFYLPPGKTIRVDGPLNITRAGFKIVGTNKTYPGGTTTSSSIVTSSATNDVIRINANSVALYGVDIRGTGSRSTSVNAAALQARAIVVGTTTRTVTDGAITLGDQTLTSATANFTASDVGCRIHIAGAYTGTSTPSITSINSTTSVEVSIAADVTVTGATTTIAPVYRDFTMEDCSVHSHAIGLHLYNSSNETVRFNQLHGFYAVKLECDVAADIGDRVFTGNEYNTSGASGTKCVYHLSGGSPRFIGDKFQTAQIQYHMTWGTGTSGGPQFVGCIWENASNRHAYIEDDGTGSNIIYHVIFDGNIFNGAPTAQIEFSDAGGTGWCKRVSVTGNIFATSSGTQLLVGKAVSSMLVDSNLFVGDGGETAIDIKSGAVNVNVMPGNVYDGVTTDISNASTTSSVNTVKRAGTTLTLTNTTDTNSVQGLIVQGDRATPANADTVFQTFRLSNLSGTQVEMARITAGMSSGTAGAEAGSLTFSVVTGGALSNELFLNQAQLAPVSNDGLALGAGSTAWSDLYLASGGALNFANGDWIATHSTGILTVGTGDLRVTTAGTNAASVVTVGGTQTLTSKTLTSPAINSGTVGTTLNPSANDAATLGQSGTAFSDLFLASGAVINFNAGDVTVTHSANALAFAGASSGYSFDAAVTISGSNFNINATQPTFQFKDTSSTNVDGKTVRVRHFQSGGQDYFRWDALDDAGATANLIFDIQKTGINVNYVDIYNGAGTRILRVNSSGIDVVGAGQMDSLRIDQTATAIGTGAKTISNAADSTTNFGKYFSMNLNGTTVYVPCSTVAPT